VVPPAGVSTVLVLSLLHYIRREGQVVLCESGHLISLTQGGTNY